MTEPTTTRREAADPFGEWASSKDALMSYRYLASAPRAVVELHVIIRLRQQQDFKRRGGRAFLGVAAP